MNADDLLRRALKAIDENRLNNFFELANDIRDYLGAPKDDPIGYVFQYSDGALGSDLYYTPEEAVEYTEGEGIGVPVFLHPPTKTAPKKPMTEEEIMDFLGESSYRSRGIFEGFMAGVRFAEKFHGIGGGDE